MVDEVVTNGMCWWEAPRDYYIDGMPIRWIYVNAETKRIEGAIGLYDDDSNFLIWRAFVGPYRAVGDYLDFESAKKAVRNWIDE